MHLLPAYDLNLSQITEPEPDELTLRQASIFSAKVPHTGPTQATHH